MNQLHPADAILQNGACLLTVEYRRVLRDENMYALELCVAPAVQGTRSEGAPC